MITSWNNNATTTGSIIKNNQNSKLSNNHIESVINKSKSYEDCQSYNNQTISNNHSRNASYNATGDAFGGSSNYKLVIGKKSKFKNKKSQYRSNQ